MGEVGLACPIPKRCDQRYCVPSALTSLSSLGQIVSELVASLWLSVRVPRYSTPTVDYEVRHTVPAIDAVIIGPFDQAVVEHRYIFSPTSLSYSGP